MKETNFYKYSILFTIGGLLFSIVLFTTCQSKQSKIVDSGNPAEYGKPNIIMIVVDDLRWDEFSFAGHPYLQTPNIDKLAKEGIVFESAYHATPLCSPNRASILTGQYPSMHGIVDNVARNKASHQLRLFSSELQKAGYETAHIGKWHLGNDPTPRPGYDYWCCLPGQGRIIDPVLYENGSLDTKNGYVTDILTDKAIDFIHEKKDRPFFLYIGHKAVHPDAKQLDDGSLDLNYGSKYIPALKYDGIYDGFKYEKRKNAICSYKSIDTSSVTGIILNNKNTPEISNQFGKILDHFTSQETIQKRAEMILSIDESMGRLLKELEVQQILENTFILFTSDNGYFFGEHGLSLERRLPYEESVRTPLIIRYSPLIENNMSCQEFVLSIDYAPTVLMLAGAQIGSHIQGKSIIPLLEGNSENWRKSFLIEYYSFENPFPWLIDTDYKVLRDERFKYIHWIRHDNKNELYDLVKDPYELNNLISYPEKQGIIKEMENELSVAVGKSFGLKNR